MVLEANIGRGILCSRYRIRSNGRPADNPVRVLLHTLVYGYSLRKIKVVADYPFTIDTPSEELHIITVRQRPPWQEVLALDVETPRPEIEEYFKELEHQLRETASHLGACVGSVKVSKGNPGNAILKHIKRISPEMVVLCRKRRPGADKWSMNDSGKHFKEGEP